MTIRKKVIPLQGSLNDAKLTRSTTGACPKDNRRAG